MSIKPVPFYLSHNIKHPLRILFCGFILLISQNLLWSAVSDIEIVEKWLNATTWQWQAELPMPKFPVDEKNQTCAIEISGLENLARDGYPSIPVYQKIINALPDEIAFTVQTGLEKVVPLPAVMSISQDIPIAGEGTNQEKIILPKTKNFSAYPMRLVEIEFLGYLKGIPLSSVKIFPCQLIEQGKRLKYFGSVTVQVQVKPGTRLQKSVATDEQALLKALDIAPGSIRKIAKQSPTLAKPAVTFPAGKVLAKLIVDEDGIYRVSCRALSDSGIALKKVDPRTFRLFNQQHEVPIYVYGESDGIFHNNDYIEFFGQRNRNSVADYEYDPFTDKNVYWLTWGENYGLRYAEESVQVNSPIDETVVPIDYLYTAHIEVNAAFERLGQVDVDQPTHVRDHWFFDSGIFGGTAREYVFHLSYPNPNQINNFNAQLRMQGLTYGDAGDHQADYFINNIKVASGAWNGQKAYTLENSASQVLHNNFLKHGENVLRVQVSGADPTDKYSKVAVDYLKVKYFRLYKADEDELDFTRPESSIDGLYTFTLSNFNTSDISIYKVGKSKLRDFTTEYIKSTNSYRVMLQDYVRDDTTLYWAACGEALKFPLSVKLDTIIGLSSIPSGAEVVVITRQEWVNNLSKLTDFYASIGLSSQVVGIEDIYNEFNAGIISPFAIKKFLQYVCYNWNPVPEYILLVGDADIKEERSIPSYFFQSYSYGACASDFWYALIDDDDVPDYAIGRWPCSTIEELEALIDKRLNYTKHNLIGPWNNELLFIAGQENVFKNQSENMIQRQISKEYNINRIYVNPASVGSRFYGGSDTLLYLFNNGITLGNFMGHGGGAVWGDRSLFNSSHIPELENLDRLPFLTSMTCFTGDFTNVTGLGEMLLLAENGGAIGLWGASSVGWIKNDYLLAKPFYDVIFEPGMTVGKAIQTAKIRYQAEAFDYLRLSLIYSYNLIGDPTVGLPFPEQSTLLNLSQTNPAPGDTVILRGDLPFEAGKMYIQLFDSSKYAVYEKPAEVPFSSSNLHHEIILPTNINPGNTYVNYYIESKTAKQDAHGATLFDIKGLTFYGFDYAPSSPGEKTPITLSIYTELSNVQSFFCEIDTVSAYEYLDGDGIEHIISFQNDSVLLSIRMGEVESVANKWQTTQVFQVGTPGKLVAVRFVAIDSSGNRTVSPAYSIRIKSLPDLRPIGIAQGGERFPELIAEVSYNGNDTLSAVVKAERRVDEKFELFGSKEVVFLPNRATSVKLPGILGKDTVIFRITVDPENTVAESNEMNNSLSQSMVINTFAVLPTCGTTYDGSQSDTILVGSVFKVAIAPLSVADSAVLILQIDTNLTIASQPKFSLVSPDSGFEALGLKATGGNSTSTSLLAVNVTVDLSNCPAASQIDDVGIGKWNPSLRIWYNEEGQKEGMKIKTTSTIPGTFSLITNTDTKPPNLELNLEGQQFFQNSYVSDRPSISIIGEDDNGVRFDAEGIKVIIDNNEVALENLHAPDTVSSGHYFSVQFRPTFTHGNHSMEVTLKDAAGNSTTESVGFIVAEELKLIDYGNYPNPFRNRTTFIYELTQRVNSLKIKIYTTSGRLVRVLDSENVFESGLDLNEGGYHEVVWDGLDADGNFVANGIYFYKISAKSGNKTVTKTGKLAKAR
ncbi:MAG TPA: C25 family cysteine peptidase [Candidatus Marinimicrobia bacterium]|nr:C25 family cysteine peptidase [Candidatus Neomarinimicrobiota bacterium]HQK10625.1 C25 family cysteine peptidase [Candidatus Neomarinimicrobiota bacterium]